MARGCSARRRPARSGSWPGPPHAERGTAQCPSCCDCNLVGNLWGARAVRLGTERQGVGGVALHAPWHEPPRPRALLGWIHRPVKAQSDASPHTGTASMVRKPCAPGAGERHRVGGGLRLQGQYPLVRPTRWDTRAPFPSGAASRVSAWRARARRGAATAPGRTRRRRSRPCGATARAAPSPRRAPPCPTACAASRRARR